MNERKEPEKASKLLRVRHVAEMLGVSQRHVWRMADAGHMPRPLSLGGSRRWNREELQQWIAEGCPQRWALKGGVA